MNGNNRAATRKRRSPNTRRGEALKARWLHDWRRLMLEYPALAGQALASAHIEAAKFFPPEGPA